MHARTHTRTPICIGSSSMGFLFIIIILIVIIIIIIIIIIVIIIIIIIVINKNAQKNGASVPLLACLVAACLIVLAICLCMAGSSGLLRYAGPLSKLTGAPPAK